MAARRNAMSRWFLMVMILAPCLSAGQEIMRFSLSPLPGQTGVPVFVPVQEACLPVVGQHIALYEITPAGEREIACQAEAGMVPGIWFLAENEGGKKEYILRKVAGPDDSPRQITLKRNEQATTLLVRGKPLLGYNHAEVYPPEGVDPLFRRSGFIHPLWSPGGEPLTRIQAPDHYHHYGIWNPWTKTTVNGREIDFWNLLKGEGTVKFAGYLEAVEGPVFAGFSVLQEHVFFGERNREELAMREIWNIRAWNYSGEKRAVIDLTSTLNTPLQDGIMLEAYRYGGGIGFRATEKWQRENSTILTSEGKVRADADGTNARWCIVEGESSVKEGRSGILFLSHPTNRMHPEPMRVWPPDANNGRGDIFFEFCPIRHEGWKLDPLQNYTLRYRMVVFDGTMTPGEAEKHWESFAHPPKVLIKADE